MHLGRFSFSVGGGSAQSSLNRGQINFNIFSWPTIYCPPPLSQTCDSRIFCAYFIHVILWSVFVCVGASVYIEHWMRRSVCIREKVCIEVLLLFRGQRPLLLGRSSYAKTSIATKLRSLGGRESRAISLSSAVRTTTCSCNIHHTYRYVYMGRNTHTYCWRKNVCHAKVEASAALSRTPSVTRRCLCAFS